MEETCAHDSYSLKTAPKEKLLLLILYSHHSSPEVKRLLAGKIISKHTLLKKLKLFKEPKTKKSMEKTKTAVIIEEHNKRCIDYIPFDNHPRTYELRRLK